MKMINRTICLLLCMAICVTLSINYVFAATSTENIIAEEQQILSTATIEDDFADDKIIVAFKNKISLEFIDYTVESFPEINCKDVRILTHESINEAKEIVDSVFMAATQGLDLEINSDINLSKFNTMVCLTLKESGKEKVLDAIEKLQKRDDILFVGPDMVLTIDSTESELVNYSDPDAVRARIQLDELPETFENSFGVTVGIMDTGIDPDHPAFTDVNFDYGKSCDYVDNKTGWDALGDPNGHGTHVAGIIAGGVNESLNYSGVIPGVSLVSLRVFNAEGKGHLTNVVDAIESADANGIPILNYSGGAEVDIYSVSDYMPLHNAILFYDGLFICSAGNNSLNNDLPLNHHYPSDYDDLTNLIAVGASDLDDNMCDFSNYGATDVDLFAPGELILSAFPQSLCSSCSSLANSTHAAYGYHVKSGTSMATPFVTGVAALLLYYDYTLETEEIRNIIIASVDPCASLQGKCSTGGRLNAYNAVLSVLSTCSHADKRYVNNGTTHTMYCNSCNYYSTTSHDLYMYSAETSNYTVKCYNCAYSISYVESPEYVGIDNTKHRVDCPDGYNSFYEPHTPGIRNNADNVYYHNAICLYCDFTYPEQHTWIATTSGYRCKICSQTSTFLPEIMQIIPPIDNENTVAALPPVNDEEDLTE